MDICARKRKKKKVRCGAVRSGEVRCGCWRVNLAAGCGMHSEPGRIEGMNPEAGIYNALLSRQVALGLIKTNHQGGKRAFNQDNHCTKATKSRAHARIDKWRGQETADCTRCGEERRQVCGRGTPKQDPLPATSAQKTGQRRNCPKYQGRGTSRKDKQSSPCRAAMRMREEHAAHKRHDALG